MGLYDKELFRPVVQNTGLSARPAQQPQQPQPGLMRAYGKRDPSPAPASGQGLMPSAPATPAASVSVQSRDMFGRPVTLQRSAADQQRLDTARSDMDHLLSQLSPEERRELETRDAASRSHPLGAVRRMNAQRYYDYLTTMRQRYHPRGGPSATNAATAEERAAQEEMEAERVRRQEAADAQTAENNARLQAYYDRMTGQLDMNDPEVQRMMELQARNASNAVSQAARMRGIEGPMSMHVLQDQVNRSTQDGLNQLSQFRQGLGANALGMMNNNALSGQQLAHALRQLSAQERQFLMQLMENRHQFDVGSRNQLDIARMTADAQRPGFAGILGGIMGGLGDLGSGMADLFAGI